MGWKSSFARVSWDLKRCWRAISSLKSTLCAVEVRALHAGELDLAVDRDAARAAHAGAVHHDRVQDTMVVGRRTARVVSTQACIIGSGPIATTSSTFSFDRTSLSAAVTKPGRP